MMNKRYWLHISSNENRNSILKNGLIPKSILNSKQFNKEHRIDLNNLYDNKKCIFLIPFKDEIDFYDIDNIKSIVFPLPLISNGFSDIEIEDLFDKSKHNIRFYDNLKRIEKLDKRFSAESFYTLENDLNREFNNLLKKEGREFDIWIIDTKIEKINPIEDNGGYNPDYDIDNSYYVTKRISPKALELIKGDKKYRKNFKFENNSLILSFNQWKLNESAIKK